MRQISRAVSGLTQHCLARDQKLPQTSLAPHLSTSAPHKSNSPPPLLLTSPHPTSSLSHLLTTSPPHKSNSPPPLLLTTSPHHLYTSPPSHHLIFSPFHQPNLLPPKPYHLTTALQLSIILNFMSSSCLFKYFSRFFVVYIDMICFSAWTLVLLCDG